MDIQRLKKLAVGAALWYYNRQQEKILNETKKNIEFGYFRGSVVIITNIDKPSQTCSVSSLMPENYIKSHLEQNSVSLLRTMGHVVNVPLNKIEINNTTNTVRMEYIKLKIRKLKLKLED